VWDYPEKVMVAQELYGSCPMCEILQCTPMGHSTFQLLDNSGVQHFYSALLDETNIRTPHTLAVHPILNQFWQ